jgi:hypothetical protein
MTLFFVYIYLRGKGGQQYICGPMPLQTTYKDTSRLTHAEFYTPRIHMSSSKVISYTNNSPNTRVLHKVCPMLLLQASNNSNKPLKLCTPLVPLLLHKNCHTASIPTSILGCHASIQDTPCCLGPNTLLHNAKHSSFNVGHSPSQQPLPGG